MAVRAAGGLAPPRVAALIAVAAGVGAALIVLWLVHSPIVAAAFFAAGIIAVGAVAAWRLLSPSAAAAASTVDWNLARAIAAADSDAIAVTDRAGRLVCANDRYEALFGGFSTPPSLPLAGQGVAQLGIAGRSAWRDGAGEAAGLATANAAINAAIVRAGDQSDMLVWRFAAVEAKDRRIDLAPIVAGEMGDRLGRSGMGLALVEPDGPILAVNAALAERIGAGGSPVGRDLAEFVGIDATGAARIAGAPYRMVAMPVADDAAAPVLVMLLEERDSAPPPGASAAEHVGNLVRMIPFGMALVDRDGRFVQANAGFVRAAGIEQQALPLYPGDLVVREDKAAVADAVRRHANGAGHSTDMAVRLATHPDEPVVLTIAGARGLGDAAVLLSLKDNSEESRLKREVAQATKMQAVGQLAGGVAHDFNNILTAIIGHCDLMLMRHSPGDSDYDDIQQIRHNSNRAAALTRQLLAFSRQQTLRPQILQLPDIVSEASHLLKRLMGETVKLVVRHDRDLGPVRADPGQLDQVIVNLAVNARDAMQESAGGGTLTIQTRAVSAVEVRRMKSDVLPPADYSALIVSDTGAGIPADVLPKLFEPFFTTKEVGKGTGLGLSTVYGIVKQSGGYIFAESPAEGGARFTIYLPVHAAAGVARAQPTRAVAQAKTGDLWGSGTILLVEDEDMVRAVAERALARQGYTVMSAENGEVALELIAGSGRPDLLISDVVMPSMDGPTMARRVRERYPELPILFMSGYAEEQLRRSIDLDRVAFLPKPFSVQQLAEAARTALS